MAYASVGALHPSTIVAAITRKVRHHRHPGLDPGGIVIAPHNSFYDHTRPVLASD